MGHNRRNRFVCCGRIVELQPGRYEALKAIWPDRVLSLDEFYQAAVKDHAKETTDGGGQGVNLPDQSNASPSELSPFDRAKEQANLLDRRGRELVANKLRSPRPNRDPRRFRHCSPCHPLLDMSLSDLTRRRDAVWHGSLCHACLVAALQRPVPLPLNERVAWSITDAARALGVSSRLLTRLIAEGRIPVSRLRRRASCSTRLRCGRRSSDRARTIVRLASNRRPLRKRPRAGQVARLARSLTSIRLSRSRAVAAVRGLLSPLSSLSERHAHGIDLSRP